jgi:hypothetical protein
MQTYIVFFYRLLFYKLILSDTLNHCKLNTHAEIQYVHSILGSRIFTCFNLWVDQLFTWQPFCPCWGWRKEMQAPTAAGIQLKNIIKTATDVSFLHMNFLLALLHLEAYIILFPRLCNSYSLYGSIHRVHTEWQRPLSGAHSIMMSGCTPTPFHYIYHQVQSCSVRSS